MVYNAGYVPEIVYNLNSDNGRIFCHSARLLANLAAEMPNEFTDVSTFVYAHTYLTLRSTLSRWVLSRCLPQDWAFQ